MINETKIPTGMLCFILRNRNISNFTKLLIHKSILKNVGILTYRVEKWSRKGNMHELLATEMDYLVCLRKT
jgi:hypothetical protein